MVSHMCIIQYHFKQCLVTQYMYDIPHNDMHTQSVCETHDTTVQASSRQDWIGKISIGV